ncbi:brain tumor protein [Ischnura elegans]|uniref:brain tumor protein n=1 Tax=Ischnura elegans TaxID=197161 RepID=UPI001ED89390|nr:brain tumor protein [Ischnura elegans]XP_046394576.1 brain tumor protein [Ischnura elegans]
MASPTPSLESLPGANSLGSLVDHLDSPTLLPLGNLDTTSSVIGGCTGGGSSSSSVKSVGSSTSGGGSNTSINSGSHGGCFPSGAPPLSTKCSLCHETFTVPKVLPCCLRTFCAPCLEKQQERPDRVTCTQCHTESTLSSQGVAGLLADYAVANVLEAAALESAGGFSCSSSSSSSSSSSGIGSGSGDHDPHCTGCKSKESSAVGHCLDCANYLCPNCVMAHQYMHCFDGHRVLSLGELQQHVKEEGGSGKLPGVLNGTSDEKTVVCPRHKGEPLKYFCRTCSVPVCKECTLMEHGPGAGGGVHECERLSVEACQAQVELVASAVREGKAKASDIRVALKNLDHTTSRLQVQYHKAQNEINETFQFYRSMIDERKQDLLKELESVFNAKQISLSVFGQKAQETVDKIYQTCEFIERLIKYASNTEVLLFKKILDDKLQAYLSGAPDASLLHTVTDLEFVSNYQAIQVGVRNTFGYVRSSPDLPVGPSKQPPIARPTNGTPNSTNHANGASVSNMNGVGNATNGIHSPLNGVGGVGLNGVLERPYTNGLVSSFESTLISKRFSSGANSLGPFSATLGDLNLNVLNPYEKWSNGGGSSGNGGVGSGADCIFPNGVGNSGVGLNGGGDHFPMPGGPGSGPGAIGAGSGSGGSSGDPMLDLTSKLMSSATIFPPKSQIKRQKMIYHCKFGEFGVLEGQFTEPSGVAVNAQNDIIVADTNNHRIQIFDKEGRFKFQFGECGKRDGQLLYPNRVAAVRTSGDIVVTERSPTHQIQIYNQYGQFVRKFGANILQHPRGVTVDSKGRIVVVECKVMRVIIFDQGGNVLQKFGCSKHLEFPNGVVVNDQQEIFISDNRAHCVKVFNYEGTYLRQIGGEGVTNYPIGVGINAAGEILIADNHNNFNLTIFTQEGVLVSALESKVKHAQCFDVALMDDGSVVLASKDYRLYIYRYVQVPPIGL